MVCPADGEAKDPRPASGLSASSKLKHEDENEGRERFSNWCPVLNMSRFSSGGCTEEPGTRNEETRNFL